MERLKIALLSLTITILTFMFGPLVLSALLCYAYIYCDDRPKVNDKIKKVTRIHLYFFCTLPFIFLYFFKYFGVHEDVFEVFDYIFLLKVVKFYDFGFDASYSDSLMAFYVSHFFTNFFVFVFSFYCFKNRDKRFMGLSNQGFNIKIKIEKKLFFIVFFGFLFVSIFFMSYFSYLGESIYDIGFYKGVLWNVLCYPGYVIFNVFFISSFKLKT